MERMQPEARVFYQGAMAALEDAGVPFLVGGAYAFAWYTGIERHTKDFDLFVDPLDAERALHALRARGHRVERTFPHWLGKAFSGDAFVDVIHSSGNGVARVDAGWFAHAVRGTVLDREVALLPVEEMIWSKAFIQERERYDGGDVAHLLLARGRDLDWARLLGRFGDHWRVLLAHLVLFGFVYPGERDAVPRPILEGLLARLTADLEEEGDASVCRGPLLSRLQYLPDLRGRGYRDPRLRPLGAMSEGEIAVWTKAGEDETQV